MRGLNLLIIIGFLTAATQALAYNPKRCFSMRVKGSFWKYTFGGNLSTDNMTKKHGTVGSTYHSTMEGLTSLVDPSVIIGSTSSTVQFSSSFGACSYLGYKQDMRKMYAEAHLPQVKEQIAFGRGDHLRSLYHYSNCQDGAFRTFRSKLQQNYRTISQFHEGKEDAFIRYLDLVILSDSDLRHSCQLAPNAA